MHNYLKQKLDQLRKNLKEKKIKISDLPKKTIYIDPEIYNYGKGIAGIADEDYNMFIAEAILERAQKITDQKLK